MQTIDQAGHPLDGHDARVRRWQQTGREDGFEDDENARTPSRLARNAFRPDEPVGIVGFGRSLIRAFGYCLVFVLWAMMGAVGSIGALIVSAPKPGQSDPIWIIPVLTGFVGVGVQYWINQRRRGR